MVERLIKLRKALNYSQSEFAARLGVKRSSISMIETENNPLTDKSVKLICMTFNVSEKWLRTGAGQMFNDSPYEKEFFSIYRNLLPETQNALLNLVKELLDTQTKLQSANENPGKKRERRAKSPQIS
jgi:transcriptional regulator with XRE-family HTH domain